MDAAVAVANAAYTSTWSKASVTERSNVLLKIAGLALALIPTLALALALALALVLTLTLTLTPTLTRQRTTPSCARRR